MYRDFLEAIEDIGFQDSHLPLSQSAFLGFDTETTGLNAQKDSIVSASLVLRHADKNITPDIRYEWYIKPFTPLSEAAAKVNGLTIEFLEINGREGSEALEEILDIISRAQNNNIPLLAYNAPFDISMLRSNGQHYHLLGLGARLQPPTRTDLLVADPLIMDRSLSDRAGRRTLSSVTEHYGISPEGEFHNALADTIATADLMQSLIGTYQILENLTLENLMSWQRESHKTWVEHKRQSSPNGFQPSALWL